MEKNPMVLRRQKASLHEEKTGCVRLDLGSRVLQLRSLNSTCCAEHFQPHALLCSFKNKEAFHLANILHEKIHKSETVCSLVLKIETQKYIL